jgi:uncharacterized repeat protein (TIGR03803 family)
MGFAVRNTLMAALAGLAGLAGTLDAARAAAKLDVLYSFCQQVNCPDGDQPYAGLTLDASGRLLGTTGFGGAYNGGTVFALASKGGSWSLATLQSFCVGTPPNCQSDEGPSVSLIEDTKGDIYGSAYFGGANGDGAVFELKPLSHGKYKLDTLHSFNKTDGSGPFELSYAGESTGAPYDGTSPLYSTTIAGGTNNSGTVFSLTPNGKSWTFQTLYNFCSASGCSDGALPRAGVVLDSAGNLYGTTSYQGADSGGTIFELSSAGGVWSETLLYTFCSQSGCADGSGPFAGLAWDTSGKLYGTTYFGGAQNDGVVFELAPNGTRSRYKVLHTFCAETNCADGSEPAAAVAVDSAGHIFGTTGRGGDNNFGTVFEVTKGRFKRVYSFCEGGGGCADGGYPYGTPIFDSSGALLGTTQYGGSKSLGEVYRLKP